MTECVSPDLIRQARRCARPLKRFAVAVSRSVVRTAASGNRSRAILQRLYGRLSYQRKEWLHARFRDLFYKEGGQLEPGGWTISFAGRTIFVPLSAARAGLDWDFALSVLGHDADVKATYEGLLRSPTTPDLFIDVGANYGTHSILFLLHGVRTISFEPNPACHAYFRAVCAANHFEPQIEQIALGPDRKIVTLHFPRGEEWLGSLDPLVVAKLASSNTLDSVTVEQKCLDDYINDFSRYQHPVLKLDTEGSEVGILHGGSMFLKRCRPVIIFECFPSHRVPAFETLSRCGYATYALPWRSALHPLTKGDFFTSARSNFCAIPSKC
jgi:FkbM family methyltransferase